MPGKRKVGDGSTYRWWLKQFELLGYNHKVLYLNSMFFGVGQSRDRGYWVFWDKKLPTPDLEHRPESWCDRCQTIVAGRAGRGRPASRRPGRCGTASSTTTAARRATAR